MSISVKEFKEIQEKVQFANILNSMKGDGWKADIPLIQTQLQPGLDILLDKDTVGEINKTLVPYIKKVNRKLLKAVKDVEKGTIAKLGEVEGLLDEMYERFPYLNPDYVAPTLPEKLPAPEEK